MTDSLKVTDSNPQTLLSPQTSTQNWQNATNTQTSAVPKIACMPRSEETQMKAIVKKSVAEYWPLYQKKFPKAFENNYDLKKSLPEIVFLHTPAELKKYNLTPKQAAAFVRSNNPNKIYIYVPGTTDWYKEGYKNVTAVVAHELMHCITNKAIRRMDRDKQYNDFAGTTLRKKISIPAWWHDNQKQSFTVQELLEEGVAEKVPVITTGIEYNNRGYRPYRVLNKELIDMPGIGFETYKKAMIESDYDSYQKVVKAAGQLADKYNKDYHDNIQSNPIYNLYDRTFREKDD